jgi:tripartite-type tricarboxylate transporter receptor subunit TctC
MIKTCSNKISISVLLSVGLIANSHAIADETYPTRHVTIVAPFAAGSGTDTAARIIAQILQEGLGQPFVVENRVGANGLLAGTAVARANPDGYTLLLTTSSTHSVVYGLYKSVPYDPIKDFTPITRIGSFPSFVAVNEGLPIHSIQELVTYAKSNPGKLSYGVGNSTGQIVGEAIKNRMGIDIVRVNYRSNPAAVSDLVAGHIQMMIPDFTTGMPQVDTHNIRPLAVLTRHRNPRLPDVPTLHETIMPNYDLLAWAGMFGPANLPPQVTKVLADVMEKALVEPGVQERLQKSGTEVYWSGPQDFDAFVRSELVKWTASIKEAGIEPQ